MGARPSRLACQNTPVGMALRPDGISFPLTMPYTIWLVGWELYLMGFRGWCLNVWVSGREGDVVTEVAVRDLFNISSFKYFRLLSDCFTDVCM